MSHYRKRFVQFNMLLIGIVLTVMVAAVAVYMVNDYRNSLRLTMEQVVAAEGAHTLPQHYAFLELKEGMDRVERKKVLAKANIFPIWYPEGEHDESIEALLLALMEDS